VARSECTEPAAPAADALPRLRRIAPADFAALRAFVHGLSPATGYKRLFSGRLPDDDELRRWSAIDFDREEALVAVVGSTPDEQIVGVARYVHDGAPEAEFAIVLADAWQRRGLGTRLLGTLVYTARQQGVHRLVGLTQATNAGMLALAQALGFTSGRASDPALRRLTLQLRP
jgi:acetyltransferase